MQCVLIVGSPGAGKSTFARRLAARTGLPLTHLDELYWTPGWVRAERTLWQERLQAALAAEAWLINGNYSSTLLHRAYRANAVLFLTAPRWQCLWRAFWREALGRFPHGPQQAGWPSRALLRDIWTFPAQAQWQLAQLQTVPGLEIIILKSDGDMEKFLNSVQTR